MSKPIKDSSLPKDVTAVGKILKASKSHELSDIGSKLIRKTPELSDMWKSLERRKEGADDGWVWAFLETTKAYSELPRYHNKTLNERGEAAVKIMELASNLATKLKANDLDGHIVNCEGKLFNGLYVYEDFTDSNQARIDLANSNKVLMSGLVVSIAKRAEEILLSASVPGNQSTNAAARRFIRLLCDRNKMLYDSPLNKVAATAANAIFGTSYSESSIPGILNR